MRKDAKEFKRYLEKSVGLGNQCLTYVKAMDHVDRAMEAEDVAECKIALSELREAQVSLLAEAMLCSEEWVPGSLEKAQRVTQGDFD